MVSTFGTLALVLVLALPVMAAGATVID